MISMTWPQYRRHECTIDGRRVRLCPMFTEALATMLAAGPRYVSRSEMIEALWPNPDLEPEYAWSMVDRCILGLRRNGVTIETYWCVGWRIPRHARDNQSERLAA